jgi:hypothetical protein
METLIAMAPDEKVKKYRERLAEKARQRVVENLFPKITGEVAGRRRLVDQPPLLYHVSDPAFEERVREALADYRQSLSDERRVLMDRYHLEDFAVKVVGIGSVGTRCFIGLFFDEEDHPLMLQFKEQRRSVLEPYAGKSHYENQGQRVVMGQRLMQSSSDIFLGWLRGQRGYDFFVRQLRDMKMSVVLDEMTAAQLNRYGYLGKGDTFDEAIGAFSLAYADQTERDHAALVKAVRAGRLEALVEE